MADLFQRLTETPTTTSHEGGAVFKVDDRVALRRFLIIGSFDTFYTTGKANTKEWKARVDEIVRRNPHMALLEVQDVAERRLAQRKDPMLFVLARLTMPDVVREVRRSAAESVHMYAETGTDLLHFMEYRYGASRTSNRTFRRAVSRWFTSRDVGMLALQAVKYDQRDGWSMRDVLRLIRLADEPDKPVRSLLYRWMANPEARLTVPYADIPVSRVEERGAEDAARLLIGYSELRMPHVSGARAAKLIRQYRIPREAVPSGFLGDPMVWDALKEDMPSQAFIRNLGKLGSLGLLSRDDTDRIMRAARVVHPFALLLAKAVYDTGQSVKGDLSWSPVHEVSAALDDAFVAAFGDLKVDHDARPLIALDVSGSMEGRIGNPLTPLLGEAGLSMVLAKQYPNAFFVAFAGGRVGLRGWNRDPSLTPIEIHGQTYRGVLDNIARLSQLWGPTDINLPFELAARDEKYSSVIVMTDNETRNKHLVPDVLKRIYREHPGFRAAVVAMEANEISVLDPRDSRQSDFVGLDASLPRLLTMFLDGDLG